MWIEQLISLNCKPVKSRNVKRSTVPYLTVKPVFVFAIYLSNDILTPFSGSLAPTVCHD